MEKKNSKYFFFTEVSDAKATYLQSQNAGARWSYCDCKTPPLEKRILLKSLETLCYVEDL